MAFKQTVDHFYGKDGDSTKGQGFLGSVKIQIEKREANGWFVHTMNTLTCATSADYDWIECIVVYRQSKS